MKKSDSVLIHSVGKAMELLEILLQRQTAMSLSELTEASGYPKSTVYGLLATMMDYSMIAQQPNGKYYLGIRLFECGCAVSRKWNISAIAHPYLEQLANDTQSSAFISVMDRDSILNVEQVTSSTGIQIAYETGIRLPLHATSQGKLFLSQLSDSAVKSKMSNIGMPSFTPHTIITINDLLQALHKIASDGYSIADGEHKIGLRSVSAPVYNYEGKMIYAIGIIGLFRSVRSEEFKDIILCVQGAARQLSNAIGYN